MDQQRSIIKPELRERRDSAAKSLQEYKLKVEQNYQEYVSQASEQYTNDFESLSRPSIKSMPVRTKDLLNKYKAQLEIVPKAQSKAVLQTEVKQFEESIQQKSVQSSEPPKNPFEESRKTKPDEPDISFQKIEENEIQLDNLSSGPKHPFENSSVMQYTQTQLLDPYGKTISDKNQISHYTSQESSNIQNLSQTQEKSLDSQQFYDTIEEQQQPFDQSSKTNTGTQCQKFDHNYQPSSRTYNSIKEEIQDESSSMTHSSHQEDRGHYQSNQSPVYESIDQESQLVENTQRWSQYQAIPQNTAQFNPNVQTTIFEVKQEDNNSQSNGQSFEQPDNNSKLKQTKDNQIIYKKLSQELVVDIDKFENSKLLNSINKTQLLFLAEKYFDYCKESLRQQLLSEFRVVKKLQFYIWERNEQKMKNCLKELKKYKIKQLEKQEKERISRKFSFQRQQNLIQQIMLALKYNVENTQQFIQNVKNRIGLYKIKVIMNKWKYQTYNAKMKKQMDLQYKQFLFTGWQKVAKKEKKEKDIKSLTFFYFNKIRKFYQTWKSFTYTQQILHQKYINACQSVRFMRKKMYLNQWKEFIQLVKKEKEFEAYAKQANEYIPIKVNLKTQNIKIYNIKQI